MKNQITIFLLLVAAIVSAQSPRVFTAKCNVAQSGSGSGYWQVAVTSLNDPGGLDATEIQTNDKLLFNDGGIQYTLNITTVISAVGASATIRVSNVGVTGISSVPTTAAVISRGTDNYDFVPFPANISTNDVQLLQEKTMYDIDSLLHLTSPPFDSSDIATAGIGNTDLASKIVTKSKMADGTANKLLGYNGSGVAAEISAGSNITISGGTISATGGGSTSTTIDIIGAGQSNMVNRDDTKGTWTYTVNNRILAWQANTSTFAVANPGTNNITPEDDTTTIRNNIAWKFADYYMAEHPTDSVRLLVRSVGGQGSWLWTPKTTGTGEVSSSNARLDDLMATINATPSNFNAKVIVWHQGEQDATPVNNSANWLNNLKEIYDTLTASNRVADDAIMLVGSVSTSGTYDAINTGVDSLYYRIKDVGNRNIFGVAYDINSAIDGAHFTNEQIDVISKAYYSIYKQGYAAGPTPPPGLQWTASGSDIYRNSDVWIGPTKSRTSKFGIYYPQSDLLRIVNTGSGSNDNQQELRFNLDNNNGGGTIVDHYSEQGGSPTTRNRIRFNNADITIEGVSPSNDIAIFAESSITLGQPTTTAQNFTVTGTSTVLQGQNIKAIKANNNDALITGTLTSGVYGDYAGIGFTMSNGTYNLAAIRASFQPLNGNNPSDLHFYTTTNISTLVERMRLTGAGLFGVGTASPTATITANGNVLAANNTSLASESLTNTALTSGTSWSATNDCALTANAATWAFSAGGASTLTQTSGTMAIAGVGNRTYKLAYDVSGKTGSPIASLTTAFSAASVPLPLIAGTNTVYFTATTSPSDFVITSTLSSGQAFTLDNLTLKQVTGGDVQAAGQFTGGGTSGVKVEGDGDVGIGTTAPTSTSIFDVVSTTKGSRPMPQGTFAQRAAISSPANGLWFYTTNTNKPSWYNGSAWRVPVDSTTAAATFFPLAGTTTNNNASTGNVGEYVSSVIATGSSVPLTTATPANVTSISLTAGDWDVEGWVNYDYGSATVTQSRAGINTTSATIPTDGSEAYSATQLTLTSAVGTISLTRKRISIASTTTVYLVGQATFSAGTTSAFGGITARRVR